MSTVESVGATREMRRLEVAIRALERFDLTRVLERRGGDGRNRHQQAKVAFVERRRRSVALQDDGAKYFFERHERRRKHGSRGSGGGRAVDSCAVGRLVAQHAGRFTQHPLDNRPAHLNRLPRVAAARPSNGRADLGRTIAGEHDRAAARRYDVRDQLEKRTLQRHQAADCADGRADPNERVQIPRQAQHRGRWVELTAGEHILAAHHDRGRRERGRLLDGDAGRGHTGL
jgi:hypothetical protein